MDVTREIEALRPALSLAETEESWDTISAAITKISTMVQDGACDNPRDFVPAIRSCAAPLNSAMKSERTRLSGTAIECINSIAAGLGASFDPLIQLFFPTLLLLCARTNKVVVTRARNAIFVIIDNTQLPSLLHYLQSSISDKSASMRLASAEAALKCLNCFNPADIEREARAIDVEIIIRTSAKDANADIRKVSRKLFEAYKILVPGRVASFVAPLSPTTKKYLDISSSKGGPIPMPAKVVHSRSASQLSTRPDARSMPPPPVPVRAQTQVSLHTSKSQGAESSKGHMRSASHASGSSIQTIAPTPLSRSTSALEEVQGMPVGEASSGPTRKRVISVSARRAAGLPDIARSSTPVESSRSTPIESAAQRHPRPMEKRPTRKVEPPKFSQPRPASRAEKGSAPSSRSVSRAEKASVPLSRPASVTEKPIIKPTTSSAKTTEPHKPALPKNSVPATSQRVSTNALPKVTKDMTKTSWSGEAKTQETKKPSKPAWGSSSKPNPLTKPTIKSSGPVVQRGVKAAASVPLPKSPEVAAAEVPLPPSPSPAQPVELQPSTPPHFQLDIEESTPSTPPRSNLPFNLSADRTPISALLFSIAQGFDFDASPSKLADAEEAPVKLPRLHPLVPRASEERQVLNDVEMNQ